MECERCKLLEAIVAQLRAGRHTGVTLKPHDYGLEKAVPPNAFREFYRLDDTEGSNPDAWKKPLPLGDPNNVADARK